MSVGSNPTLSAQGRLPRKPPFVMYPQASAATNPPMGLVVTVSGAVGGIGTSTFAYALALQQASSVLIDAQPDGTPIDLLIGAERETGTRWRQVHVTTGIDATTVLTALPQWQSVHLLSSDREATAHTGALTHIVAALREEHMVVIDVDARNPIIETVQPDLRVLLVPTTIYGLGAALASTSLDCVVVVVESLLADFTIADLRSYLPQACVADIRHERGVWQALRNATPPPVNTSVMTAAQVVYAYATGSH